MELTKLKKISLKGNREFNEQWVQDRIAQDESILGLGNVVLKDKERIQPRAGRLDLLLQDLESLQRYEVEIQLGALDESHIIRTIEYWDIERRRYPQYEHTAVIVAEDITSRFLNVISLFNGMIPLMAIKMDALQVDNDRVGLVFTKIISPMSFGLIDEDEETQETTDRAYWENKGSHETVAMADELLALAKQHCDDSLNLKYNKYYIGLERNGRAYNFFYVRPQKKLIHFQPKIENSSETTEKLENAGLDVGGYDNRWGCYKISLRPGELKEHEDIIVEMMKEAFEARN